MRKRYLIGFVIVSSLIVISIIYRMCISEKPQSKYLILEIPRIVYSPTYKDEFADSEEFSTFIWNDSGHQYYIWRMDTWTSLSYEEVDSIEYVVNYYDGWVKKLGWVVADDRNCISYKEYKPNGIYRSYSFPTKYYVDPIACMVIWPDAGINILIKTINPSQNVLEDWDL